MRKLIRSVKKKSDLPLSQKVRQKTPFKTTFTEVQPKIVFRCDSFLLDRIKNTLASQHLAGNYEYPNLSYFFRSALYAYQKGMPLTYTRELGNPKKEISFRMTEELMRFYNTLPLSSRTEIMERALGSYYGGLG